MNGASGKFVRMKNIFFIFIALSWQLSAQRPLPAKKTTRVLFIFDASKSMVTKFEGKTRMEGAKELFYKLLDTLTRDKNTLVALRMYGHTVSYPPGDCKDSKLVVPFAAGNKELIRQKVREAKPTGITPIEHSLTEAANDFKDANSINIVIIITDGIEECGGDPCAARQKLMEKGIVFRPFVIGIGLSPANIKTFECVGDFFQFEDSETFGKVTSIIQQQRMNRTTAQVNLLDERGYPSETNVAMSFEDVNRKAYKYNYVHTMNEQGYPDTLFLDDFPTYRVTAFTIPQKQSELIKLVPGRHTIIPLNTPQGSIRINRREGPFSFNEKVKCIVRLADGNKSTLHVQRLNTGERYLTGTYELEVLTLPRTYINAVEVQQSQVKTVEIASAGQLTIRVPSQGDGCILVKRDNRLEWVTNLTPQAFQTYYLQPGKYVAVWRSRNLKGSIYTIERQFEIVSDQPTTVGFVQ